MRSTKRNKIEIENKNKRRYEKLEEGGLEKEEGKKEALAAKAKNM